MTHISPNITIVRGEFDKPKIILPENTNSELKNNTRELPLTSIINIGNFRIGCCSGYTVVPKNDPVSLLILARQLDVDILLWSGTHNVEAYTLEGKFFVNPGSCTGAFNADWPVIIDNNVPIQTQPQGDDENEKSVDKNEEKDIDVTEADKTSDDINNHVGMPATDDKNNINEEEMEEANITIPENIATGSNTPSFCLFDIQGSTCTLYIYIYVNGDVRVDKVVYKKQEEPEDNEN